MNRFKCHFYSIEKIVFRNHRHEYIQDADGYLFADSIYPTKIKPEDLPPWYVFGRYYKRFGYLCSKGVTDLVYRPCAWTNHFLKDDCLMISYHGKIVTDDTKLPSLDAYTEYDERIWGNEILNFIKGARDYSGYDITRIVEQILEKADWMPIAFSMEFAHFSFDVKAYIDRPSQKER